MPTVVLVDDEPWVREGLRLLLGRVAGLTVVGEAGDGTEAVRLVRALRPDIVLLDLALPDLDGLVVAATLRATLPSCAVVIHSLRDDAATRARARAAGAAAFVGKGAGAGALLATLRRVLAVPSP